MLSHLASRTRPAKCRTGGTKKAVCKQRKIQHRLYSDEAQPTPKPYSRPGSRPSPGQYSSNKPKVDNYTGHRKPNQYNNTTGTNQGSNQGGDMSKNPRQYNSGYNYANKQANTVSQAKIGSYNYQKSYQSKPRQNEQATKSENGEEPVAQRGSAHEHYQKIKEARGDEREQSRLADQMARRQQRRTDIKPVKYDLKSLDPREADNADALVSVIKVDGIEAAVTKLRDSVKSNTVAEAVARSQVNDSLKFYTVSNQHETTISLFEEACKYPETMPGSQIFRSVLSSVDKLNQSFKHRQILTNLDFYESEPTVLALYNQAITYSVGKQDYSEALELYRQLTEGEFIFPDTATLNTMMGACAGLKDDVSMESIFKMYDTFGFQRNASTYNCYLAAVLQGPEGYMKARDVINDMLQAGIQPTPHTFKLLVTDAVKRGLVIPALELLQLMKTSYFQPTTDLVLPIIGAITPQDLASASFVSSIYSRLRNLQMKWTALLAAPIVQACLIHFDSREQLVTSIIDELANEILPLPVWSTNAAQTHANILRCLLKLGQVERVETQLRHDISHDVTLTPDLCDDLIAHYTNLNQTDVADKYSQRKDLYAKKLRDFATQDAEEAQSMTAPDLTKSLVESSVSAE